jgi:hypothetical protein
MLPNIRAYSLLSSLMTSYVQYGCAFTAPLEWINFDASPTVKFERIPLIGRMYTLNERRFPPNVRIGDIVQGLPIPDHGCKGIYASHVLEHLALDDFHKALDNTKRLLGDGGVFRCVVPDLEWYAREYIRRLDANDPGASALFLESSCLGCPTRARGLFNFLRTWLKNSAHLWMWDETSLRHALQQHGFSNIRRCDFGDCEDPMFSLVEDRSRFETAIAMEAR